MDSTLFAQEFADKLMTLTHERRHGCMMWVIERLRGSSSDAPLRERLVLPHVLDTKAHCLSYISGLITLSSTDEFYRVVQALLREYSEATLKAHRVGKKRREERNGGNPY